MSFTYLWAKIFNNTDKQTTDFGENPPYSAAVAYTRLSYLNYLPFTLYVSIHILFQLKHFEEEIKMPYGWDCNLYENIATNHMCSNTSALRCKYLWIKFKCDLHKKLRRFCPQDSDAYRRIACVTISDGRRI